MSLAASESQRCTGSSFVYEDVAGPPGSWTHVLGSNGQPLKKHCQAWAVRGTNPPRCINHMYDKGPESGGRRDVRKYLNQHRGEMRALMEGLDIPQQNPMDGLLETVRQSGVMMRVLWLLVSDLPQEPVLQRDDDGVIVVESGLWGLDHTGDQAPHVLLSQYRIWLEVHTKACKLAIDAGIDERMVRNAEMTNSLLLAAFEAAVGQVQLDDATRTLLKRALAQEVRKVLALEAVVQQ